MASNGTSSAFYSQLRDPDQNTTTKSTTYWSTICIDRSTSWTPASQVFWKLACLLWLIDVGCWLPASHYYWWFQISHGCTSCRMENLPLFANFKVSTVNCCRIYQQYHLCWFAGWAWRFEIQKHNKHPGFQTTKPSHRIFKPPIISIHGESIIHSDNLR